MGVCEQPWRSETSVPIVRSTLFASGCRGVQKIGEHPIRRINSRVNSQVKFVALSLETLEGMPVNCQKDNMASQQFLAVRLLSGTACGNREVLSRKTTA